MIHILLIDDDKLFHESFRSTLETNELRCSFAANSKLAFEQLEKNAFQLIFLDLDLGKEYGLDLIEAIKEFNTPICILSGTASIHTTVQALKLGAMDVLEKPISKVDIERLIKKYALHSKPEALPVKWLSPRMIECDGQIRQIAPTAAKILLRGETGVGKEVLARQIHALSDRKNGEFVAVNCGAIPENLIENELFGSVKGAFTGSDKDYVGSIRSAKGGTLFLDEIAELPLAVQAKLLRFLQESEVKPVGSDKTEVVDVRVIAATHRNLEEMVAGGEFREDLYFRINVFTIDIPPLRERQEDLAILIDDIIEKQKISYKNNLSFQPETIEHLKGYDWAGNIRELSNLIERLMLTVFHPVKISDLPQNFRQFEALEVETKFQTLKAAREDFERRFILDALKDAKSLKEVSERLQIERTTLYKKMKALGIEE